jgi:ribosomal protein L2
MALKTYKPNTPGLRQRTTLDYGELTTSRPEKSLTVGLSQKAGRDSKGRISMRQRNPRRQNVNREEKHRHRREGKKKRK